MKNSPLIEVAFKNIRSSFYSTQSSSTIGDYKNLKNGVIEDLRGIMRKVPQAVVAVTTCAPNDPTQRRGITVSSFTSICLHPEPLVSFCVRTPSRASELLHSSGKMVVNVLSHEQVQQSIAFSSPGTEQFKDIPFYDDPSTGLPVLMGTVGSMYCETFKVLVLGDHELWITRVIKVEEGVGGTEGRCEEGQALLYHDRRYRSVGEQVFMKAFEDSTLDTSQWTHRAHVRMAWNHLRELGLRDGAPVIKHTIRVHSEKNADKLKYHDTISSFYIHLVNLAIQQDDSDNDDFFGFIERYPALVDRTIIQQYYSSSLLASDKARQQFVPPDLKELPAQLPWPSQ
ncbi:flavin reductase like domain-containing protein [Phycomyces nitens]|nr:flavin reductase like domain-containing protein [Phycomyces nitens]